MNPSEFKQGMYVRYQDRKWLVHYLTVDEKQVVIQKGATYKTVPIQDVERCYI